MILHIFNNQKKFSKGYFQMLVDNGISLEDMKLLHYGKKDDYFDKLGLDTVFISNFFNPLSNAKLIKPLFRAEKIVVHSLASPYLLIMIALFPSIAKKVYWVIWGKDLYFYHTLKNPKFYHRIYECIRKSAIRKITKICSIFKEDYELACKWYGVHASNIEMVTLYPYALETSSGNRSIKAEYKDKKITILLGNSGSSTNNHFEALEILANCNESIERIICPLSYGGSSKYVKKVIRYGKQLFGDKFYPLCDFMPKDDYFRIMAGVDVGIFNYDRQEGLGNIWSLILSGKTVYMKHETSTTSFFRRNGIVVKDIQDCKKNGILLLSEEIIKNNEERLSPLINVDMSISKWKQVL